jgi:transglutaminase-like putative cysteine protease
MGMSMTSLKNEADFLTSTSIVDWHHPDVSALASRLAGSEGDAEIIARRCFEWVRDEIQHCMDFDRIELTCKASEVLACRTGFCYAKSHLLAALLRANNIPAGFCYQRLSIDGYGPPFSLHGLNAVWLPAYGWYRVDCRGNKLGVDAQFTPPIEQLAFSVRLAREFDLPGVWAEPLPQIIDALTGYDRADLLAANLPDLSDCAVG